MTVTRVTGKFQITLPKRLVEAYGIRVGDEVELIASGETISIVPAHATKSVLPAEERLRLFDAATWRIKKMNANNPLPASPDRSWTRDDIYEELHTRGRPG